MIDKISFDLKGNSKVLLNKSDGKRIIAGYGCLSDDSEILTINGWKNYKDISINEEIYSYNKEKNILERDKIVNIFKYPYEDKLVYLQSSSEKTNGGYFKWLLTPNHKVLYKKDDKLYIKEAKDLPSGIEIPTTSEYINPNDEYPISDDYIKLLAWIITEGNIDKESKCIWITQSIKENSDYVNDIRHCLNNEKISFSEYDAEENTIKRFRIFKNEPKLQLIKEFLNKDNFHEIPRWIINSLSQRQLLLFYNTLINGDGSRKKDTNGETFYTELKENADTVQELGILLGYSTKCRKRRNCWEVFLNKNRQFRTIQGGDIDLEDYYGIVWCVETKNHTFIARRDGVPFITGNSVAVVDLEKQYIPLEVLKKGIQSLLSDLSYANLMIMHKNIQIGKIIPSYGKYKTGVDHNGLMIVAEIRKDIKIADEVWGMILKKELTSFSIGCEVLLSHKVCDEKECITILDKINIFEVSICSEGINQESKFSVISKSDFEKLQSNVNVLNVDNNGKIMTEEKKVEEKKCEECTPPAEPQVTELSIEERLENLEKSIERFLKPIEKAPEQPPVEQPPVPPPQEAPPAPPEEKKPEQWSSEESMAVFMLDYIIKHPKSTAQDIAKAWIKSKQPKEESVDSGPESLPDVPKSPMMDPLSFAEKKSVEDLSKKVDTAIEELKLSLKARDDTIQSFEKKLESLIPKKEDIPIEKPKEVQSKTIQVPQEPKMEMENPIAVKDGLVTSSEFI